jgi:hypothetical protein
LSRTARSNGSLRLKSVNCILLTQILSPAGLMKRPLPVWSGRAAGPLTYVESTARGWKRQTERKASNRFRDYLQNLSLSHVPRSLPGQERG